MAVLTNTDHAGTQILVHRLLRAGFGMRPDGEPVTVSIGISECLADNVPDWPHLIELADQRIYLAKQSGRHRYALSDTRAVDYLASEQTDHEARLAST